MPIGGARGRKIGDVGTWDWIGTLGFGSTECKHATAKRGTGSYLTHCKKSLFWARWKKLLDSNMKLFRVFKQSGSLQSTLVFRVPKKQNKVEQARKYHEPGVLFLPSLLQRVCVRQI